MSYLASSSVNYLELIRTVNALRPECQRQGEDIYYIIWRYNNEERTQRIDTEGDDWRVTAGALDSTFCWLAEAPSTNVRPISRVVTFDMETGFATRRDTVLEVDLTPTRQESGKVSNKYGSSQVASTDTNSTTITAPGF